MAEVVACVPSQRRTSPWHMEGQNGFAVCGAQPLPFMPLVGHLGFFDVPADSSSQIIQNNNSPMTTAYPLAWPTGWPRKTDSQRADARFGRQQRSTVNYTNGTSASWSHKKALTVSDGVKRVLDELRRLGARPGCTVISTNVVLRQDGLPRSGQREPGDSGVAVYWHDLTGAPRVMAIDQYRAVADNLAAVAATLEAMRAIERHGGAQILERAFTGFTALPAPAAPGSWRELIGLPAAETDLPSCVRLTEGEPRPRTRTGREALTTTWLGLRPRCGRQNGNCSDRSRRTCYRNDPAPLGAADGQPTDERAGPARRDRPEA